MQYRIKVNIETIEYIVNENHAKMVVGIKAQILNNNNEVLSEAIRFIDEYENINRCEEEAIMLAEERAEPIKTIYVQEYLETPDGSEPVRIDPESVQKVFHAEVDYQENKKIMECMGKYYEVPNGTKRIFKEIKDE